MTVLQSGAILQRVREVDATCHTSVTITCIKQASRQISANICHRLVLGQPESPPFQFSSSTSFDSSLFEGIMFPPYFLCHLAGFDPIKVS